MLQKISRKNIIYGILTGLLLILYEALVYGFSSRLSALLGFTPFSCKIDAVDDMIPVIPVFILIYFWAYVFWITTPVAIMKTGREHMADFIFTYLITFLLGGIFMVFFPTSMDRVAEGLYDNDSTGLFRSLMRFCYSVDGKETASNLIPSFHCMNSVLFCLGVRKQTQVSVGYRIYAFIIMLLIFASTVFTKQHYITDVFTGIIPAVIIYAVCDALHPGRLLIKLTDLFRKKEKK